MPYCRGGSVAICSPHRSGSYPGKVGDVDFALGKLAKRFSTRSVRLARMILIQAVRNAMVNDLVVRNVADLTAVPAGLPGRPSRSLDLEQALAVLDAARESACGHMSP